MRTISLAIAGLVVLGAAATPAAADQYTGFSSYRPARQHSSMTATKSKFFQGARQVTAQRAANMINEGDCKGALRMALRENDYTMADRIVDVCRLKV